MNKQFVRTLLASTCFVTASFAGMQASLAAAASAVPVVADAIGGVVTSSKGPEAGVWVVAETHDLPTRFIKIVVTDDQGRFLLPELPKAKYTVFVRGYGLVDSKPVAGTPGANVNLTAVVAADAKAAAQYYPPNYWFSLIQPPAESEFPGTGPKGNGISPGMQTQQVWVQQMTDQCQQCHQQGNAATRVFDQNTVEGWAERITKARADGDHVLGDHGKDYAKNMGNAMTQFGRQRALSMWADWTKRVAGGELPKDTPPRPQGVERNIVLTSWDWANGRYTHDLVSTDRHNPTVNAGGPIYGITAMIGYIEVLDVQKGQPSEVGYKVTPNKGVEVLPESTVPDAFPHNPMMDSKGRVWVTDLGRYAGPAPGAAPAPDKMPYCTDPANKYAKYYPEPGKTTNTAVLYDPKTKKIEGVPMCNGIHHLMFNVNSKDLYFSGGDQKVVTWIDTKAWDETHDPQKSVNWCPMVLDTNSTTPNKAGGVSDVSVTPDHTQWNEPAVATRLAAGEEGGGGMVQAAAVDPKKDTRVAGFLYGVDANVQDGSMWFAKTNPFPSSFVRFHPGTNPPETCKTEMYEPPKLPDGKSYLTYNARGVSVDSHGVAWGFHGPGQLSRFDRSKCKVLSGPTATGQQCPEGWSAFDAPGPRISGTKSGSADFHYLGWVDLHDTLGMGKDTPIVAGSNSDSLLAFNDTTKKFTVLRVPYPMGFRTRGLDGRIDNKGTGWKGKAVFASYSSAPVWHQEGGEDASGPQMVKFQVRPDPLAY